MTTTEQLAPRGYAAITSANRGLVRKWLTAEGATYDQVSRLTVAELSALYNDTTDNALKTLISTPATPAPQTTPAPAMTTPAPQTDATAAAFAALVATLTPAAPALDEARIVELIEEHAPRQEPRKIHVTTSANAAPVIIDRQHWKFPLLLATIAARVPAYLVGPAGTGKTHSAKAAAEALNLQCAAISVGPMTSKGDLFGMRDAHGVYHKSDLVRLAEEGGVFLFDEFDSGNAGVLTSINMLLANGDFSTPAGMVKKHADFVPMFGLNTFGTGASREYVGRQQLDAATLDRGGFIDWPCDEGLEASLVGFNDGSNRLDLSAGGVPQGRQWLDMVQAARRQCAAAGLRHVISPRATLYGYQLAAAGVGLDHLWPMLITKGLDATAAAKLSPPSHAAQFVA